MSRPIFETTIYSRLARSLGLRRPHLSGALTDATLVGLLCGGPLGIVVLIWLSVNRDALGTRPTYLLPTTLLAVIWLPIAPFMTVLWDRLLASTLETLRTDSAAGWNNSDIQSGLDRTRRYYWPCIVFSCGVALVAVAFGASLLQEMFALDGALGKILGFAVVTALGLIAGTGIWGTIVTIRLLVIATRDLVDWHPFTVGQTMGLEALSRFGYAAGLALSLSSLQAPVFYRVASVLPPVPRGAIYVAISTILGSGLAVFGTASALISSLTRRQKKAALDPLADQLRQGWEDLVADRAIPTQLSRLSMLLELRQAIRGERAEPYLNFTMTRAVTTVLIPVLVGCVPLFLAR